MMKGQKIVLCKDGSCYEEIERILKEEHMKAPLLVCGASAKNLRIYAYIMSLGLRVTTFSGYEPNPTYGSVVAGVRAYQMAGCDGIIGIAGGSGLDVAKCIKMFASMSPVPDYLQQSVEENGIPMIAIPTTAGTGSESTRYSIIYVNGEKQTITHDSSIPEYVFLDGETLAGLPDYQRKATMLDALAHAIESYWSAKSTEESKKYAKEAITRIFASMKQYIDNTPEGNEEMLYAANLAGRAINITGTTAAHAMCYKLTKKFSLAHGHAVSLTIPHLWHYMLAHMEDVSDARGMEYVQKTFEELAVFMGFESPTAAADGIWKLMVMYGLETLVPADEDCIEEMTAAVDVNKLESNPIRLTTSAIHYLYKDVSVI